MKTPNYKEWSQMTQDEKIKYNKEIFDKIKYDEEGFATNLEYFQFEKWWISTIGLSNCLKCLHRIKPKKKWIPFDEESIVPHLDKWFKYSNINVKRKITSYDNTYVWFNNLRYAYQEICDVLVIFDPKTGQESPCGVEVSCE
jgi:hypothetical protein